MTKVVGDKDFIWRLKQVTPGMLSRQQIAAMAKKMNNFDHVKAADYNFGACFLAKWVLSLYNAALLKSKKVMKSFSKISDYQTNSSIETTEKSRFGGSSMAMNNQTPITRGKITFNVLQRATKSREPSLLRGHPR